MENPVVIQQSPNLGEKQPGWQVKVSWTNLENQTSQIWVRAGDEYDYREGVLSALIIKGTHRLGNQVPGKSYHYVEELETVSRMVIVNEKLPDAEIERQRDAVKSNVKAKVQEALKGKVEAEGAIKLRLEQRINDFPKGTMLVHAFYNDPSGNVQDRVTVAFIDKDGSFKCYEAWK